MVFYQRIYPMIYTPDKTGGLITAERLYFVGEISYFHVHIY